MLFKPDDHDEIDLRMSEIQEEMRSLQQDSARSPAEQAAQWSALATLYNELQALEESAQHPASDRPPTAGRQHL